jgi:hypothetical protein
LPDDIQLAADAQTATPLTGGDIADAEAWPKNESGSVNWEVVFELTQTLLKNCDQRHR